MPSKRAEKVLVQSFQDQFIQEQLMQSCGFEDRKWKEKGQPAEAGAVTLQSATHIMVACKEEGFEIRKTAIVTGTAMQHHQTAVHHTCIEVGYNSRKTAMVTGIIFCNPTAKDDH